MFNFSLNNLNSGEDLFRGGLDQAETTEDLNFAGKSKRAVENFFPNRVHPMEIERQSSEERKSLPKFKSPKSPPESSTPILQKTFQSLVSLQRVNTIIEADPWVVKRELIKALLSAFFQFIFEVLAVINLILMTYYRLNYLSDGYTDICFAIEVIVLTIFIIESINILKNIWYEGFSIEFCLKFCANFLMIFQILWMFAILPLENKILDASILINVIRSFRIFGIKNFFFRIRKAISPEEETENVTLQLSYFVVINLINIGSAIFIQATLFLALDAMENYQGYNKKYFFNEFEYVSAMYFSMSTITTIGYGDIYPVKVSSRVVLMAILCLNLSVVSVFLGKLTDIIYLTSPYIKQYNFKNHIIILGEMPMSFLKYFLLEIQESDKIYQNSKNTLKEEKGLRHVLIVKQDKPSPEFEILMGDASFDFEINYLYDNSFGKKWPDMSNLKQAKHLFLFSIMPQENEHLSIEKDYSLVATAKKIEAEFEIPMTLVLSTDTCEAFSFSSKKITVISQRLLNNRIIASSLENHGFTTWLTHLMTLREKRIPFISEKEGRESNFFRMFEYAKSMSQEIYALSNIIWVF